MENNETIIRITGIEQKTGKTGRQYASIKTDKGTMTCFEKDILERLQEGFEKSVQCLVNVAESNGFSNIRSFVRFRLENGQGKVIVEKPSEFVESQGYKPDKFSDARAAKDTSIYTSYAKDLFIELYKENVTLTEQARANNLSLMQEAVKLVKEAREAF